MEEPMVKNLMALIAESGAAGGDLVYIRSTNGLISSFQARLSTAPDLLKLKVEALGMDEPLIVAGPFTDETFADVVIDANAPEPSIIKAKGADLSTGQAAAS
jgi:hypothetical protein